MPRLAWFGKAARFARLPALGIGLLVVAGCGPPEAGSVKLPAELRQGAKPGYGPVGAKAATRPLGVGLFRVEPKTKPGRRRGG
jgi:hypothetical protein